MKSAPRLPISTAVLEVSPSDPYSHLHDLDNFPVNTSKQKEISKFEWTISSSSQADYLACINILK